MHILQVVMAFFPCQIWGGPPQNTFVLSKALINKGHDVRILTSNILNYKQPINPTTLESEWQGIPVTYLKTHWWGRRSDSIGFIWYRDVWRYRHLIRDADIVHIQDYRYHLAVCSAFLAKCYGVPYLIQPRGSLPSRLGRSRLKLVFDRTIGSLMLRGAAGAIALNDEEIENLVQIGVVRDRVTKILNPMDPDICDWLSDGQVFREKHGIAPHEKVVLFLSRIHSKKGLDLLIRAVAKLKHPDVRLCIVGPDDGFAEQAQSLIDELALTREAQIIGPLYDRAKYEAYAAADVYVLPTRGQEGLPTTIVEACCAGVPIIVTRTTEVSSIIDGRAGIAIDYDIDQLVIALSRILEDDNLRQQFERGAAALLSEYFDLDTAVDRFLTVYGNAS